jgi:hypothetical protein
MSACHRLFIASHLFLIVSIALWQIPCNAQPAPDPSLWEPPVFNPSGQRVVPVVYYDATTGILGLDTRGLNRIKDTPDYTTIPGPIEYDDVGFIGFLLHTPITGGTFFPPFDQLFDPVQGLIYHADYSGGAYTLLAMGATGRFLWPGVYSVLQLPTGLKQSDFPFVEMAVSFGPIPQCCGVFIPAPNRVQIVPEPSVHMVLTTALLCLGCLFQGTSLSERNAQEALLCDVVSPDAVFDALPAVGVLGI